MAALRDIEITHDLMECPVCGMTIKAKVTIQPKVGMPTLDPDKQYAVSLNIESKMTRFNVNHICTGPVATHDEGANA